MRNSEGVSDPKILGKEGFFFSYIARDNPEPRQSKAPNPRPTTGQSKEVRKGNGFSLQAVRCITIFI